MLGEEHWFYRACFYFCMVWPSYLFFLLL